MVEKRNLRETLEQRARATWPSRRRQIEREWAEWAIKQVAHDDGDDVIFPFDDAEQYARFVIGVWPDGDAAEIRRRARNDQAYRARLLEIARSGRYDGKEAVAIAMQFDAFIKRIGSAATSD